MHGTLEDYIVKKKILIALYLFSLLLLLHLENVIRSVHIITLSLQKKRHELAEKWRPNCYKISVVFSSQHFYILLFSPFGEKVCFILNFLLLQSNTLVHGLLIFYFYFLFFFEHGWICCCLDTFSIFSALFFISLLYIYYFIIFISSSSFRLYNLLLVIFYCPRNT